MKRKASVWKQIEQDFRSGTISIRQMAKWYKITEGAIRKRAKLENWSGLQRPDEPMGTFHEVTVIPAVEPDEEAKTVFTDGRSLALRMLDELSATTSFQGELEDLILNETAGDRDGRRRTAMMRAVDLGNRARVLKDLMSAAKIAIETSKLEKAAGDGQQAGQAPEADKSVDDWSRLLMN